jgi:hypothetical protein
MLAAAVSGGLVVYVSRSKWCSLAATYYWFLTERCDSKLERANNYLFKHSSDVSGIEMVLLRLSR